MKIRTGFVSNSSSSSFVAFVDKKDYDKAFKQLKDEEKRILGFFPPESFKYKNHDFVKLVNNESDGELYINQLDYIDEDCLEEVFPEEFKKSLSSKNRYYNHDRYEFQQNILQAFNSLIEKLKGQILEHSEYH